MDLAGDIGAKSLKNTLTRARVETGNSSTMTKLPGTKRLGHEAAMLNLGEASSDYLFR